jgi:hypothetical protein
MADGAKLYAKMKLSNIGIPKSDKDYKKLFDEYVYEYNYQAYTQSFTPFEDEFSSGLENPSSPRISANTFEQYDGMFGSRGFFSKYDNVENIDDLERRFKQAVSLLSTILLELKYGIKTSGKKGKSDMAYAQGGKDKLAVTERMYFRNAVASLLAASIEDVYTSDPKQFTKIILDNFPGLEGVDLYRALHMPENRQGFARAIYKAAKGLGFEFEMKEPKKMKSPKVESAASDDLSAKKMSVYNKANEIIISLIDDEISLVDAESKLQKLGLPADARLVILTMAEDGYYDQSEALDIAKDVA